MNSADNQQVHVARFNLYYLYCPCIRRSKVSTGPRMSRSPNGRGRL